MDVNEPVKFYRFEDTELSQHEQEQLLLTIGETDNAKQSGLESLKKSLQEQTEFQASLDENFLLQFLRIEKFDVSKTFKRIKKFYKTQKNFPDHYEFCAPEALKKAELNEILISPYRLKDHSILVFNKYCNRDLKELSVKEKYYLDMLLSYEVLKNPLNQMCGYTFIVDLTGLSVSKVFQYDIQFLRAAADRLQGAFPYRTRAIHFVNTPSLYKIVYNLCLPLLTTKLKQRMHFHSDNIFFQDLQEFIPPELLLEEYNGNLKASDCINPMKNIYEKEKYFRKHSPYLYIEEEKLK